MALDQQLLAEGEAARVRLLAAERSVVAARADYYEVIRRMHAAGGSMREIGDRLGLSHQRVHQVITAACNGNDDVESPAVRSLGPVEHSSGEKLEHLGESGKRVVLLAGQEARALGRDQVEPEHLLLRVLREDDGPVADAAAALRLTYADVCVAVIETTGQHMPTPRQRRRVRRQNGALPVAALVHVALQDALREAQALGHDRVEAEHILLALATQPYGVATRVLDTVAGGGHAVRDAVDRALQQ